MVPGLRSPVSLPPQKAAAAAAAVAAVSENGAAAGGAGPLKSGRRRWGQTGVRASDSWDESDPTEAAVPHSKKPSLGHVEEERGPREQPRQ